MIYLYQCPKCKNSKEVDKPMSEATREEKCKCGEILQRVYNTVCIKTNDGVKLG